MVCLLENDYLRVQVDSKGAELKSIKKQKDEQNVEYLWQLNPDIWERQAPLLFPIIGRLKDEEYICNGKAYKIQIHGFARFSEFKVKRISDCEIAFILYDSPGTISVFPFKFKLTVIYRLSENRIIKEHIVENKSDETMYYEIGGHEGYNLALNEGEKMEDYYIDFNGADEIETYTSDENVMLNKDKKTIALENGKLFLSPEVFKNDALIIDTFNKRSIELKNTKNSRSVKVDFNDFMYLGIWTKYMRSNYVCIEPWSSLPDCNYLGKEIEKKQDIRIVRANEKEKLTYTISIY